MQTQAQQHWGPRENADPTVPSSGSWSESGGKLLGAKAAQGVLWWRVSQGSSTASGEEGLACEGWWGEQCFSSLSSLFTLILSWPYGMPNL